MSFRSLLLLLSFFTFAGSAAVSQDKASAPASEASPEPRDTLMRKMNRIIIPTVQFNGTTIGAAIEYLRVKSRELDTSPDPKGVKGVNIILRSGSDEPLKQVISLDLKDVPLSEALRYVTELAGMKFKVQDEAVLVVPLSEYHNEKHTRIFRLPPDFLSIGMPAPGDPAAPADPFAAGRPEPANNKIPRQTAKQILEAQGITFPEGASATFNPATGLLTITNSQPNLDLVEAFVDTICVLPPKTIAHQLIILEGPGELIRQVNAAASRTANARKELDLLLDHAKNPGSNVRVVADAFLEGKSGMRSSSTAVREHVHATGLDLDAKSRASASWDMRPLGLTLEVEPTLGPDGTTIESDLSIKLHPATPRIRQLTVTEPLSTRDAEFPFSIIAGAEFTTTLTTTSGATKLIGVTKPVALADEKADVLWAAFVTSNVRHVLSLPQAQSSQTPAPNGLASAIFPAPPGLLESLMETPQKPLREWLEKEQGITFPAGAVLEQKGDQLHVTNTPAMIEAISVLISHAGASAAKTIAFTLHTIEAPAALLRDHSRQSTAAGADDTAIFAAVETAVTRGEARFIDSLFFETKSGNRATHESVREHSFLSDFGSNAQNLPEATFDTRRVGSVFEVEPVIGADGHTVELNFSHELHPAPPETRGAHFRDPASGKPFAMPATDFHVLKTTSGLSITKGSTKLLSLHQPTGRDAAGKLWATFLKCDVVPQISKPYEIELIQKRKGPDAEGLETRVFKAPADFINFGGGRENTEPDPFAANETSLEPAREGILEHKGFIFPKGASARFNPADSTLTVRNSPENLVRVEAFLKDIDSKSSKTIALTTHVLQAPGPLLRRLTAQAAVKSNHRAEFDELLAAVKAGTAQSLGTHRIETKSGVICSTQQGTEHTALSEVRFNKEGVPEIITETRNVGFKVELEAIIGADGQLVDLNIAPEFHTAAPFEHREHILDTQGRKLNFPLTDYHIAKVTTAITLPSGTARLLSLHKPTGRPEFDKEDILQAIFITCDLLRTGE